MTVESGHKTGQLMSYESYDSLLYESSGKDHCLPTESLVVQFSLGSVIYGA